MFCTSLFFGYLTIVTILIYFYLKKCYRYWKVKNVPYVKPKSLLFGSNLDLILHRISFQEYHATLYKELAPHRYGGYFNFQRPFLLIRDPDLVKHILSIDFQTFSVRHNDADDTEPLRLHLFNLYGDKWRVLREKLSTAFSPAKIRMMVHLMKECAQELVHVLDKSADGNTDVSISDIVARYGKNLYYRIHI